MHKKLIFYFFRKVLYDIESGDLQITLGSGQT